MRAACNVPGYTPRLGADGGGDHASARTSAVSTEAPQKVLNPEKLWCKEDLSQAWASYGEMCRRHTMAQAETARNMAD